MEDLRGGRKLNQAMERRIWRRRSKKKRAREVKAEVKGSEARPGFQTVALHVDT